MASNFKNDTVNSEHVKMWEEFFLINVKSLLIFFHFFFNEKKNHHT